MDAHYDAQIAKNQDNFVTHVGPARQFGSGAAGLGALAVRIGRCTLPLLKKYALSIAKKVGRNLVSAAIPEIGQMIAGKKKLKAAAKDSVSKTISDSVELSRSAPKRPRTTHASGATPSVHPPAGLSPPPQGILIIQQTGDKKDNLAQADSKIPEQQHFQKLKSQTQSS